jgi:hypothetical protein
MVMENGVLFASSGLRLPVMSRSFWEKEAQMKMILTVYEFETLWLILAFISPDFQNLSLLY